MTDNGPDKIFRMAWKDRNTFDDIKKESGPNESQVIKLMGKELQPSGFRMRRKQVAGRIIKHRGRFRLNVTVPKRRSPVLQDDLPGTF